MSTGDHPGAEFRLHGGVKDLGTSFALDPSFLTTFRTLPYSFGYPESQFGAIVFHRTYSRLKPDGTQESWYDVCQRVIEGIFTIRKWWFNVHCLPWNVSEMQQRAQRMATSLLKMTWTPPGRGLWATGTDYVYERGSFSLYNCAYVTVNDLAHDVEWIMNALMVGAGVGYSHGKTPQQMIKPLSDQKYTYSIPDSREGWAYSVRCLLSSYLTPGGPSVSFDYSMIRPEGAPIRGFGGTASGPAPLRLLHERVRDRCEKYVDGKLTWVEVVSDIVNCVAEGVVAGNVRRSSLINIGSPRDDIFLDLKDYEKYPERLSWGRMSNNTCKFQDRMDFRQIPEVVKRVLRSGDPGIFNGINAQRYARYGDTSYGEDTGIGLNPCGEAILEDYETCVHGDTWLITEESIDHIANYENQQVNIWNGQKWSPVTVRKTAHLQKLMRVSFADGTYLDVTPYHRFSLKHRFQKTYQSVEAQAIEKSFTYTPHTEPFTMVNTSTSYHADAYTLGVFTGDGCVDDSRCSASSQRKPQLRLWLYGKKLGLPVQGVRGKVVKKPGYTVESCHVRITADIDLCRALRYDEEGLRGLFSWDRASVLAFMAGWIDADGADTSSGGVKLFISGRVRGELAQLLLTKNGIRSSLNLMAKKGEYTNKGMRTEDLYYLQIIECAEIPCYRINTRGGHEARMKGKWQNIRKVEWLEGVHDVYCFTEPETHKAVFNNSLTYQCDLAEVYPTRSTSKREFLQAVEDATFFASTVILYPTHSAETNTVIARNRRIGVSVTGVSEWFDTWTVTKCIQWLKEGYHRVREENERVNREAGIPRSIRTTVIKPSGTVSQLAGVPSGMHFLLFHYCIRRIIVAKDHPVTPLLIRAGYPFEPQVDIVPLQEAQCLTPFPKYQAFCSSPMMVAVESLKSFVFEIPLKNNGKRSADEVSAWEQFCIAATLQREWADQAVSCTITFDPATEGGQLEHMLSQFIPVLKTCALLPRLEGIYPQMPFEEITKEDYETRLCQLKPIDWAAFRGSDGQDERYCTTDQCEIRIT